MNDMGVLTKRFELAGGTQEYPRLSDWARAERVQPAGSYPEDVWSAAQELSHSSRSGIAPRRLQGLAGSTLAGALFGVPATANHIEG